MAKIYLGQDRELWERVNSSLPGRISHLSLSISFCMHLFFFLAFHLPPPTSQSEMLFFSAACLPATCNGVRILFPGAGEWGWRGKGSRHPPKFGHCHACLVTTEKHLTCVLFVLLGEGAGSPASLHGADAAAPSLLCLSVSVLLILSSTYISSLLCLSLSISLCLYIYITLYIYTLHLYFTLHFCTCVCVCHLPCCWGKR